MARSIPEIVMVRTWGGTESQIVRYNTATSMFRIKMADAEVIVGENEVDSLIMALLELRERGQQIRGE